MPMTGFEPGSSGIGSDRSANCAKTTSQNNLMFPETLNPLFQVVPSWSEKLAASSVTNSLEQDETNLQRMTPTDCLVTS